MISSSTYYQVLPYSYDADDRLSTEQYDVNGNTNFSNGDYNAYDYENRLIVRSLTPIVYDADGNRVSEDVGGESAAGGVTTNYLVDTQNPTGYAQVVDELRFMGSKGIIELTEFGVAHIPQAGVDLAPSYYCNALPARLRNPYFKQWHEEHDPKPGQEPASESGT